METMWWVMFFLNCDPAEIMKGSLSIASGMSVIEAHYTLFGIPSNLSPEDRADFMRVIQSTFCSISTNPPTGVTLLARLTFLSTLKSMWTDLGGIPEDLVC